MLSTPSSTATTQPPVPRLRGAFAAFATGAGLLVCLLLLSAGSRAFAAQPTGSPHSASILPPLSPLASATPTVAPTSTSVPACCGRLGGQILPSCSFDPQSGTFSFSYFVAVYNPCPAPAEVTVRAYVQVSVDEQTWVPVASSTPVSLVVQPGGSPAVIQGRFTAVAVPTANMLYRGLVSMYEPNECQNYISTSQPYYLCWPPATLTATPTPTQTRTATPSPTVCTTDYNYSVSSGAIVPGVDLLPGSQCSHCVVPLELPFTFTFYGQPYSAVNLSTYGNLQFVTADTSGNSCPAPYPQIGPAIMPDWDDWIDTGQTTICQSQFGRPCGVYTSISGSAPDRILNIEWLGRLIGSNHYFVNVEARLYENTSAFDFVYGVMTPPGFNGSTSTIGIQDGAGSFINYECHVAGSIWPGLLLRWTPVSCGPTPAPTQTATESPTATPSPVPPSSTATTVVSPTETGTPDPTLTTIPTDTAFATQTNTPTISPAATGTVIATSAPTVTATPTSCTIEYPDVPPGSTFYPYVHCLACRGIISGYPNGTFGPSNPVTRGQLSKIVSNAAGYNETFSANTFEDVPVGSTFFPYVERLYLHGGIGGYACGNPEPCVPPDNKPYFRPNANVTRGQTSKIVAIARELPQPPSGQQSFEDVLQGSPFWQWIEPLAAIGAIGGYPCGGEGEPCVPPANRPYFRPNANVTRGQSAKIVSSAFFPGCATLSGSPGK